MGWDISYHPISENQIKEWYFDVLENQDLINTLSAENGIEDFYKDKYSETIKTGLETTSEDIFDKHHGYFIAVVQGFFQSYFYTRGSALSFSESSLLHKYFKAWEEIVPKNKLTKEINNQIIENYCSGVYISKEKVAELLNDYKTDPEIKQELNHLFSHDRINIFLKALNFAKDNELGLLEATEVVEPNPIDLNESSCYSNLFNCDPEGALLYQKAAMEQIQAIQNSHKVKEEKASSNTAKEKKSTTQKKGKKGFWKKLFGK